MTRLYDWEYTYEHEFQKFLAEQARQDDDDAIYTQEDEE